MYHGQLTQRTFRSNIEINEKKHQSDPNGDVFSESRGENQKNVECSNINKEIKKILIYTGFQIYYEGYEKLPVDNDMVDLEFYSSLWLSSKCGNQGCGHFDWSVGAMIVVMMMSIQHTKTSFKKL
ncbi:hypothetical protein JTB14_013235 [Gonioctena quinquepunctata]|nr:hypothetical protein JTB14_013235 [Gonioctena quinquepunctata]